MQTVKVYDYEDLMDTIWHYWGNYDATHKFPIGSKKFGPILTKVRIRYAKYQPAKGVSIDRFADRLLQLVDGWNGSSDEIDGIIAREFGYNWNGDTGEWADPEIWFSISDYGFLHNIKGLDPRLSDDQRTIDKVYRIIIDNPSDADIPSRIEEALKILG